MLILLTGRGNIRAINVTPQHHVTTFDVHRFEAALEGITTTIGHFGDDACPEDELWPLRGGISRHVTVELAN